MRHYSNYTQEFREEAVALLAQPGRSIRSVADDLGINHWTLRDWYKNAMSKKKPKLKVRPVQRSAEETPEARLARLERENARLEKENVSLKQDREILKKAAAFFAKESE